MRIIMLVALALVCSSTARADDGHHHQQQDAQLHEQFYVTWYRPDNPMHSCCSKQDCYPTQFKHVGGKWFALRREDQQWVYVPEQKFEHNRRDGPPRVSPDHRSHVCMQNPKQGSLVFCALLADGM